MERIPEMTTKDQVIAEAAKHDIELTSQDVGMPERGYPTLDGLPAHEWLEIMTQD